MEDKALETLRVMIGRRGADTKTDRVVTDAIEKVNLYTIGPQLAVFSQKEKGLVERDINKIMEFAQANEYTNGVIIVSILPPSENVLKVIKAMTKDTLIQFFHIGQLMFDITTHRDFYMPHRILKEDEKIAVFKKFNITNPQEKLPWIDSQDPPVKWAGGRPGDIIEITRHSAVAGTQLYYRFCVPDVNVA
jgi:DNA-directed RNA polymerase subunit H